MAGHARAGTSLAGVVVAPTAIAWVDPVRGAFVRGYPLAALAARRPYEDVAHVILRGELPAAPWSLEADLDPDRAAIARSLAVAVGPERALIAAMPLLDGDPAAILGRLPALIAALRGAPAPSGRSYAERALRALGATRHDAAATRAFEVLLSLESEHGLSASTFACRVAASSGASSGAALAAGAAALSGPLHGGATAAARALLRSVVDPEATVARWRADRRRLPGFGHRVYKGVDPRLAPLRAAMAPLDAPLAEVAAALEAAVAASFAPKPLHANVDLWGAVLLDALGVEPPSYVAAFALGVAAGWLAHADEQRLTGELIRPDSDYVGAPERDLPR